MISKQFKIVNAILAILGIAAFLYFQQSMKADELGCFKQGTEHRYAQDNKLVSVGQCDEERNDPLINFNQKFFEGCKRFLRNKNKLSNENLF